MKAATFRRFRLTNQEEISIHAAREGGDEGQKRETRHYVISIHAAREGGDAHIDSGAPANADFNPRRP